MSVSRTGSAGRLNPTAGSEIAETQINSDQNPEQPGSESTGIQNSSSQTEQTANAGKLRLEKNLGSLPTQIQLKEAADQLSNTEGLSAKNSSDPSISHDHHYQHNQTDLEFLRLRPLLGSSISGRNTEPSSETAKANPDTDAARKK